MNKAWVTLCAAAMLLSGCAEETDKPEIEQPDNVTDGNVTAPAELIAALEIGNATGAAPLAVAFNVSVASTPDNSTWFLDFGDDTNETGALSIGNLSIVHVYEAGLYNASLMIVHDDVIMATFGATINATADAGIAPGTVLQTADFEESGTLLIGLSAECGVQDGVDAAIHAWDLSALVPEAYQVANIVMEMTLDSATNLDTDVDLIGPDGKNLGASHDFNALSGPTEHIESAGPHPAGIFEFHVAACTGANLAYTIVATADLVAA